MSRKYRPQLVLAAASTFFQQWSGINTIIFYAPQLFVSLGVGEGAALGATIVTGLVNHLATYVSFHVADKYGRRILFIEGRACNTKLPCIPCQVHTARILEGPQVLLLLLVFMSGTQNLTHVGVRRLTAY